MIFENKTYTVIWDIKALTQLYSLVDLKLAERMEKEVSKVLSVNPYGKLKTVKICLDDCKKTNIKPLRDNWKGHWRIRINDYRFIYKVIECNVSVEVFKVGDRDDVYDSSD